MRIHGIVRGHLPLFSSYFLALLGTLLEKLRRVIVSKIINNFIQSFFKDDSAARVTLLEAFNQAAGAIGPERATGGAVAGVPKTAVFWFVNSCSLLFYRVECWLTSAHSLHSHNPLFKACFGIVSFRTRSSVFSQ